MTPISLLQKSIYYFSGSSQKEEAVSVQKIQEIISKETGKNFEWIEEVKFDPKPKTLHQNFDKEVLCTDKIKNKKFQDFMKNPSNENLALRKISDVVGFGVFARKKILENEVIGLYAGKMTFAVKKKDVLNTNHYLFQIGQSPDPDSKEKDQSLMIDAERFGNMTRFLNHCPDKDDLDYFKFANNELKNSVQTANLNKEVLWYDHAAYIVFFAARNINLGEQLSYSYNGLDRFYLEPKFPLSLFTSSGATIDKNLYALKILQIENFSFGEEELVNLYYIFKNEKVPFISDPIGAKLTIEMFIKSLEDKYTASQRVLLFKEDPLDVLLKGKIER